MSAARPEGRDAPKVVAPPPLIVLGAIALGLAIDWLVPAPLLPRPWQYGLGAASFALGGGLAGWAIACFLRAGTNVPTYRPTTALVAAGPYRFSRNPIYIGLAFAYLGITLAIDSAWLLALAVPLLLVLRYGVVAREEAYLEAKFGDVYRDYKAGVRRWL
jgi:protein-S-isoprenylcysteine O-methyltransferase Ste14